MGTTNAPWSVQVGVEATTPTHAVFPTIVVAGIAPRRSARIGDLMPAHRIAGQGRANGAETVDHVRVGPGIDVSLFPGLDASEPSMVRDTVRILLAAGAPTVDVVLARSENLLPWHTGTPDAYRLLSGVLERLTAVPVLLPDASGPVRVGHRDPNPEARLAALVQTVRVWTGPFRRSYQIGVVDLPNAPEDDLFRAFQAMTRSDFVAAAWEGGGAPIRAHGWRSAAAVVGGLLATTTSPANSLVGREIVLPPGRDARALDRARSLGMHLRPRTIAEGVRDGVAAVRLSDDGLRAMMMTEPSLRGVPGTWPLPLMYAVKLVHDRLVFAANLFVFREATAAQAFLLQSALRMAVKEFEDLGVLAGPGGNEPAQIQVGHRPGPDAPGLVAQVSGFVRPWVHRLVVQVAVRPGQVAQAEVVS